MALSVFPFAREHLRDPSWWDQGGRDILDQRRILHMPSGTSQTSSLKKVLEDFPDRIYGLRMLDKCARNGCVDVLSTLLDLGLSLTVDYEEMKEKGEDYAPLHKACFAGHLGCVKLLVEKGGIEVDTVDHLDSTPLLNAARGGRYETVQWLLEKGGDPTWDREEGLGVLECATFSGKVDVLARLLDHPLSIEKKVKVTPRMIEGAAESGNVEALKFLLERAEYPMDDSEDGTWKGDLINTEQRETIETCLFRSATECSLESLNLLLSYLTKGNGDSNFQYYEISSHIKKVHVFNATIPVIENGDHANIFQLLWETLLSPPPAILDVDPEKKRLQQEWLHRRLITATSIGGLSTTKLLLEKYGANVNHISIKYHSTPLFCAAAQGHLEVVRYLLERHKADIHLGSGKFANGPTALHQAILNGHGEIVKTLLENGGPVEFLGKTIEVTPETSVYVAAVKEYRAPVLVLLEEEWREFRSEWEGVGVGEEVARAVVFRGLEDVGWAGGLEFRRGNGGLKESGERARELMRKKGFEKRVLGREEEEHCSGEPKRKRIKTVDWIEKMGMS